MTNSQSKYEQKASVGPVSVMVIGDSLTSGFCSIPGFFSYLEVELKDRGWAVDMRSNAVPGAGADLAPYAARQVVESNNIPDLVVIALGINDMICGSDSEMIGARLDEAIALLRDAGATVVLSGALVPLGEGGEYADKYDEVYGRLAQKHGAFLKPYINGALLVDKNRRKGYEIFNPELMTDSIHPNQVGAKLIAVDLAKDIDCALESRLIKNRP